WSTSKTDPGCWRTSHARSQRPASTSTWSTSPRRTGSSSGPTTSLLSGPRSARRADAAPGNENARPGAFLSHGGRNSPAPTPHLKGERDGVAGPREAGGPHGPRHACASVAREGFPTRSSREAGLAPGRVFTLVRPPAFGDSSLLAPRCQPEFPSRAA